MRTSRRIICFGAIVTLSLGICLAQYRSGGGRRFWENDSGPFVRTEGGEMVNEDTVRTARETANHSTDTPTWTNAPGFEPDAFTFARILYRRSFNGPGWLGWVNDYPDADLNLSWRLQQMTSMKTDPDGRVIRMTDADLAQFPFIFLSHPERMDLNDDEARALRQYLLNGGVLLLDDFWGERAWQSCQEHMKHVLPGRTWTELPMDHPIFHCVFDLRGPLKTLQVPTLQRWLRDYNPDDPESMPSAWRGPGSEDMHVRAWLDDKQRIMVLAIHNSDTGDGWEREGENETYFKLFSEPRAYPLGINLLFYIMTH